jgi:hypothetical protein
MTGADSLARVSLDSPVMAKRKSRPRDDTRVRDETPPGPPAGRANDDEALEGPQPREATVMRSDREREAEEHLAEYGRATSPRLTGGDVDADWERADSVGEEAVGGTVATPDQNVVDELGAALGVPRGPDEEVRTSQEILEGRDAHRWDEEG